MIPKKIYINKKTADNIGDYSSVTTSVRTSPNSYHDEVEYTALSEVWHRTEDAPAVKEKTYILAKASFLGKRLLILPVYPSTKWKEFACHFDIEKWAYVEDLLSKERKNERGYSLQH